jgi:hypothetical protein
MDQLRLTVPLQAQAGDAVAFFVGRNGSSDGIDAFVAAILNAGFGTGGEAAEVDVLQRIFQVHYLHPPNARLATTASTSHACLLHRTTSVTAQLYCL